MKRLPTMVAGLLLMAAACSDGSIGGSGTGKTKIYITDDPFPFDSIARVDVYIAKIEASTSLDTASSSGGQGWVTVAEPMKVFNLLDFQQGTAALAGEADIPAGSYRAIRLTINTSLSHVIRANNTEVPVHWPVPGELALNAYVEHALDVAEAGAQIVIDFDVGRTFASDNAGGFYFLPWIRAVNNAATGSVAGLVTAPDIEGHATPIGNVNVVVWTNPFPGASGAVVGTGRTDASGHYVIAYLSPGTYNIGVQAPASYAFNAGSAPIQISTGGQTTANFLLTRDTTGGGGGGGPDTSGVTPGGPVASLTLRIGTPSGSTTIGLCDSLPMTAELRNAQGQMLLGRTVTWQLTDSTVLTLAGVFGQYAHLRAAKAGSSTLTATSEGKSASISFTVTGSGSCGGGGGGGNTNPVATVTINPAAINATLPASDSVFASAVLKDAASAVLSGRSVTWTIADTTVMRIQGVFGQSVLLRARKVGATTLTAVSEGVSASAAVTVH